MHPTFEASPRRAVRAAGALYLAIIALGLFGEAFVRGTLVTAGDPAATASAISASPGLWRAGIAGDLLMHLLDVPVTLVLYLLLRPVSRPLALAATLFNLVQTAVLALNKLNLLLPLLLLDSASMARAFAPGQLQALSQLAINLHAHGFAIGLVFFGVACVIRGALVARSGFLPAWLGRLLQLAGVCYLVNSAALLFAPSLAEVLFPAILLPSFVGELAFALWLTVKGIDGARWR